MIYLVPSNGQPALVVPALPPSLSPSLFLARLAEALIGFALH